MRSIEPHRTVPYGFLSPWS